MRTKPTSPLGRLLTGMASQLAWHRRGRVSPEQEDFELANVIWDYLAGEGVSLQALAKVALGIGETMSHWYLTGVFLVEKCVYGQDPIANHPEWADADMALPDVDASALAVVPMRPPKICPENPENS